MRTLLIIMESQQSFVSWFRDSSPYIHAHRNKTFVISFGGEAVLDDDFDHHVLKRDGGLQPRYLRFESY